MRSRSILVRLAGLFVIAGALMLGRVASAKQVRFVGMHPITSDEGGGFCYIEVPHVHIYTPARSDVLYREHDGGHFFVGDPVPYGYEGPKHAYYGPHPVAVDVLLEERDLDGDEVEYCYLDGPHYHYYAAPAELKFKVKGGVSFFVGDLPPAYVEARPRYAKINVVYKPLHYERPVVVEAPPPEYHGPVVAVDVEPVVVEPAVEIEVPPPVEVVATPPVVGVEAHGVVAGPAVHGHVSVGVQVPTVEVRVPSAVIVEERIEVRPKKRHRHHGKSKVKGHW
jgi:hypothetical protein